MVTERIDIVVSERGSPTVRRNIEDIGGGADRSANAVDFLKRALIALGGAAVLRSLGGLLNTFANLRNRLRTVTSGTAELNLITAELLEISNRTRSSFESSVELFARTSLALRELGVSQQQTLEFTESLNQAVLLSGASATEAQAGIIQLSQGLASGALRGDELRSVLEQLPVVADVIAQSLGVTRGELRELGTQGLITADIILEAFAGAREELAERFGQTIPTIGQSFTILRNNLLTFLGSFDEAVGITRVFSGAIIFLADNIETLARIVGAAAFTIGTIFGVRALGAAVAGVRALTLAIAANPIGAIAVALTTVISLLITFSDQIRLGTGRLANLQDFGVAAFEFIADAVGRFVTFFQANFGIVADLADAVFGDVEFSIEGLLRFAARATDNLIGLFVGATRAIIAAFEFLVPAFQDIFTRALNGAIGLVESGVNAISGSLSSVLEFVGLEGISDTQLGRLENVAAGGAAQLGAAVREGFLSGFEVEVVEGALDTVLTRSEEIARERIAREQAEQAELEAAREALSQAGGGIEDLDRTIRGGVIEGIREIQDEFTNLADLTSDLLVNAFTAAEDALVNFVQTGKLSFSDLVNSILDDLTRLLVRQAVTAPLAGLLGGFSGGISDFIGGLFGSLPGAQNGFQDVPVNSLAVGSLPGVDNRLVAIRARDDETISVNRAGQGGGGVNIQINVTTPDADSFHRSEGQILDTAFQRASQFNRRNS